MHLEHSPLSHGQFNPSMHPVPPSILVVDDTASAREPLVKILRLSGYTATSAADGAEALAAIQEHKPDLILLDLMMPGVDGLSFLRRLRQDPRWNHLPVIVVTAADSSENLSAAKALGVHDCLLKAAFTVPQLLDRISRALPHA